jgi:hypothetical protein
MDDARLLTELGALLELGIPTYVIGMPGSEVYREVLEQAARAGGAPRRGEPAYYAVADEAELAEALLEIGSGLTIGCDLSLEGSPEDPHLVNVYLDRELLPQSSSDGWEWASGSEVTLRGAACEKLQAGAVSHVEIVYGCATVVR